MKTIGLGLVLLIVGIALFGGGRPSAPRLPGKAERHIVQEALTPEAAIERVFSGIDSQEPAVIWEALPAQYQRDVTDLVHEFADRVPPEVWHDMFRRFQNIKAFFQALRLRIDSETVERIGEELKNPLILAILDATVRFLEAIEIGGLSDQDQMAKADIGQLMSSVGPALFEPVWNVLQVLPEDSPYAFLVNLKNVKYVVKDMDGDRATVSFQIQRDSPRDVEFVRVEGKWIPSALAEVWATYFFTLKTAFLQQPWDIEQRRTVIKNGARLDDSLTEMIETAKSGEVFSLGDFANDMISFLIGDVQPDFDRLTQLSIVRSRGPIVILCKIPAEGEISNDYIEGQMQQAIADQFSTNGVKVVDAGQVEKWVERDLGVVDCQALGNEFMAEYVIQVELGEYSVFEPNHSDLYRGYADVAVRVYRIDENTADAHVVYEKDFDFQFPGDRPLSYRDVSHAEFRRRFHAELGAKIGRLFCAKKHSSAKSGESR